MAASRAADPHVGMAEALELRDRALELARSQSWGGRFVAAVGHVLRSLTGPSAQPPQRDRGAA